MSPVSGSVARAGAWPPRVRRWTVSTRSIPTPTAPGEDAPGEPREGAPHGAAPRHPRGTRRRAALAGVLAAALTFGLAELVAAFTGRASSPAAAIGAAFVDRVPAWLKAFVISLFGTNDKTALFVTMAVVIAALAAVAGLASLRDDRLGTAVVGALGAVAVVAALSRASAGALAALPSLVGFGVGVLVLAPLVQAARRAAAHGARGGAGSGGSGRPAGAAAGATGASRRSFLTLATAAGTVAAVAAVAGRVVSSARDAVSARAAVRLPAPARAAAPLPAGVDLDVAGITPFTIPNADFYRIDTALTVPQVDPATWSLRVHGLVEREVTLTWEQLLAGDLVESDVTLSCVSNEVGGDLVGNARWLGLLIAPLLERAGVRDGADMVLSTSTDGFTASTPLEALADARRGAILAVSMNGDPLPIEHGFPVRMVVPGLYGYVSATKWVVDLEVTRFADATAYWTDRGWSAKGPVKTASRIDVPSGRVDAGRVAVAGVAWAPTRGISAVEVQVDDGAWQAARLAETPSADTWVQWVWAWDASPGRHTLRVRATDGDGAVQTSERADVVPDGATGWDAVSVTVA